jgi:glycine/D-amino acid oxidase-like deaminating enzyme
MTQRILVIGAGFAGMWSALGAARLTILTGHEGDLEVALIAPQPDLHVRPRLYEENAASMRAPLLDIFTAVGYALYRAMFRPLPRMASRSPMSMPLVTSICWAATG